MYTSAALACVLHFIALLFFVFDSFCLFFLIPIAILSPSLHLFPLVLPLNQSHVSLARPEPLSRRYVPKRLQAADARDSEVEDGSGAADVSEGAKWDFTFVQKSALN